MLSRGRGDGQLREAQTETEHAADQHGAVVGRHRGGLWRQPRAVAVTRATRDRVLCSAMSRFYSFQSVRAKKDIITSPPRGWERAALAPLVPAGPKTRLQMEAFLRYARETRNARAPDYRPHLLASPVTPSPTDRTTLAFSSRVHDAPTFVHPLNRLRRRDLGLEEYYPCLLYTSPSPRDRQKSRMPSSA